MDWDKGTASYRAWPIRGVFTVISRLASAFLRAILVALLIATPSLILPGVGSDTTQIVALVAIFGALLTFVEYASEYPSLVEFRDAPPFNRVRFFSLFATVFLISIATLGHTDPSTLSRFVEAIGAVIGHAIDFPYSPVRLVLVALPDGAAASDVDLVRTTAGIAYLSSLLTLAIFVIFLKVSGWPYHSGSFNVWVNLPTFEPTAGGDVVERLQRDARINVALGFLLPFISPLVFVSTAEHFLPTTSGKPQTLVWVMATWAFLPASLFMRGIAMARIAEMIAQQRKKPRAQNGDGAVPAH